MIEKPATLKRTRPFGAKTEVSRTKSQSEMWGRSRIFLCDSFWARKESGRMEQRKAVFFMKKTEAAAARIKARQKILRMR